jgi:hypothetical protein
MSDEKRVPEKKVGLYVDPSGMGGGGFVVPMDGLNAGPGDPGPEDEWHMPAESVATEEKPVPETGHSDSSAAVPANPANKQ